MGFQKGGVKAPRPVIIEHTVTSDHPVVLTEDGKEIPVRSHLVCMFAVDVDGDIEYANSPQSKAELVAKYADCKTSYQLFLSWTGGQWTDLFVVALDAKDGAVEALMRGLGFAPDGGAIKIGKTKWAPTS